MLIGKCHPNEENLRGKEMRQAGGKANTSISLELPRKARCWLSHEEYLERDSLKSLLSEQSCFLSLIR